MNIVEVKFSHDNSCCFFKNENLKLKQNLYVIVNTDKGLQYGKVVNLFFDDSHYSFDRSQLLFRFVADERVDFRKLARELGAIFKTRIELRQIGIRDKAKEIGGIGPCGRLLCCSSFLKSFDSVTISMAKNQNVSLNPSKINGVCGRLLCCLRYENDNYSIQKKKFPKVGSMIELTQGTGKVVAVNVVRGSYSVEFENKVRVEVECDEEKK